MGERPISAWIEAAGRGDGSLETGPVAPHSGGHSLEVAVPQRPIGGGACGECGRLRVATPRSGGGGAHGARRVAPQLGDGLSCLVGVRCADRNGHKSYTSRPRARSPTRSPAAARRCSASSLHAAVHDGRMHGSEKPPSSGNSADQPGSPRRASSEFTTHGVASSAATGSIAVSNLTRAVQPATDSIVVRILPPHVVPHANVGCAALHSATTRQARARWLNLAMRSPLSSEPSMSSENRRVMPHASDSELPPLRTQVPMIGEPATLRRHCSIASVSVPSRGNLRCSVCRTRTSQ